MLKTPIGRLRLIGMLEAISFILLLGIAVPLKHFGDNPLAVKIVGPVHGALFIAFCLALYHVMSAHDWNIKQAFKPFIATLIPFGPFIIDRQLKAEEQKYLR